MQDLCFSRDVSIFGIFGIENEGVNDSRVEAMDIPPKREYTAGNSLTNMEGRAHI
jgi:hypothetical protein